MLTVEQLRAADPEQVAQAAAVQRARASRITELYLHARQGACMYLAGWHGGAARAAIGRGQSISGNAEQLRIVHERAADLLTRLAEQLDQAHQLITLADSFASLVGCRIHGRGEVTPLPPTLLGPLATVYDAVRRTAGSLAEQALAQADRADADAATALGGSDGVAAAAAPTTSATATGQAPEPPANQLDPAGDGGNSALASAGQIRGDEADPAGADHGAANATAGPDAGGDELSAAEVDRLADQLGAVADQSGGAPEESAGAVAAWFLPIPAGRRRAVRRARPRLVGSLAGAPLPERYAANHDLIRLARAELQRAREQSSQATPERRSLAEIRTLDAMNLRLGTLSSFLTTRTLTRIDPATGQPVTVHEERRFLSFDPSGAGRVAEVFGDLDTAAHVAVLIPGGRNTLDTFNALAADARGLRDVTGPDVAVIAWLGYDSAGAVDPADRRMAEAGAPQLHRLLAGLQPVLRPDVHLSLLAHGYGSVLTGAALAGGAYADDVVLIGSPGLGPEVHSAADLDSPAGVAGPDTGGIRFWAMRAPGDTVAYSSLHGPDPAEFPDVQRLDTDGGVDVIGHARYYATGSESVENIARVVLGRFPDVTTTNTCVDEELALAGLPADTAELARVPHNGSCPAGYEANGFLVNSAGVIIGTVAAGEPTPPAESNPPAGPIPPARPAVHDTATPVAPAPQLPAGVPPTGQARRTAR